MTDLDRLSASGQAIEYTWKEGEMPEGYNLGCIENDVAIVFPPEGKGEGYILTILSNELAGRNNEAITEFSKMSSMVAQWYLNQ